MSKFGLMADLHMHRWTQFAGTTLEGLNSRLAGLLDEVRRCANEVGAAGGKVVVMAGDVFHVRGTIAPSVLNPLRDTLANCYHSYGVTFIVLAGNHDLEGRDSERLGSAVTALECEWVKVVNEPAYFPGINVHMVPWIEDVEKLKETIKAASTLNGGPPISVAVAAKRDLIIHAPIDGVIEGLPAHGLSPEWLADLGFRRVYSGHYHHHKSMVDDKVVSIGALAHHTWSDVRSKAGFLIVDSATGEYEWRASRLPQFIDMNDLVGLDEDEIRFSVDGNFVRMRVDADQAKLVEAARADLMGMGARGVIIQAQPKQSVREGAVAATVSSGASLEASLVAWVKGNLPLDIEAQVNKAALDVLTIAESMES